MLDKIGPEDIIVQVESTSEDNHIPDGIAVSSGIYDLTLSAPTDHVTAGGLNKSSNKAQTDTFADLDGWTVRSGYTSTPFVGGKYLRADKNGQVVIAATVKFSNEQVHVPGWFFGLFGQTYYSRAMMRIVLNGKVVASASGTTAVTLNKVLTVAPGDQIHIQTRSFKARSNGAFPQVLSEGTAFVMTPYDSSTIDFEEDMAYGSDRGFYDDTWGRYVSSTYLKRGLPNATSSSIRVRIMSDIGTDNVGVEDIWASVGLNRGSAAGPILAQTRHPIPVVPGSTVKFDGVFRLRKTGSKDEQTDSGTLTGLNVRMSIWGVGYDIDEYGVESLQAKEIYFYQATLQGANDAAKTMMEYTAPTGLPAGVIPASGVSYIFWTCSLVQQEEGAYSAGTYTDSKMSGETTTGNADTTMAVAPPTSALEMRYFGWKHDAPLKITVNPPAGTRRTTVHPYSRTGVAYQNTNAEFFTNVKTGAELTFFGSPGLTSSINVYNYNGGVQGSLILSSSTTAGQVKTVTINPTGAGGIRIVNAGANPFFVESIVNPTGHTLSQIKTRQSIYNLIDINNDITKISVLREEADTGSITVDFDSTTLDPFTSETLQVGKLIRFSGRHYGVGHASRPPTWSGEAAYTPVFTGVITQATIEYDYEENPIIQVVAYDANDYFEKAKTGVVFDTYDKYVPFLNRSGHASILPNGFDVGGRATTFRDEFKFLYRPSAHGEMSLAQGLEMTRNTSKSYIIVDKDNRIKMMDTLPSTSVLTFTDGTAPGDISYGKISKKQDTRAIVNKLELKENALDPEDYKNRSLGQDDGPPHDFKYVATRVRNATYSNQESFERFGEFSKSFDVVRGTGDLKRLYRGDIGTSFENWADSFLAEHLEPKLQIHEFTVPIKNSDQIRMVSSLEILDLVTIVYKGETYQLRIKEIEHTVYPGKWFVVLKFTADNQMTMW